MLPGDLPVSRPAIREWAENAARDVAGYYGRFPLPRALVMVVPGGRRAVGYGTTMGNGGASVLIWVGAQAREEDLRRDWVLTHELSHLTLPNVPRAQRWLEEGLATYVEPIARARRGRLSAEEVWGDLVRRTPEQQEHRVDRSERRDPDASERFEAPLAEELDRRHQAGVDFPAAEGRSRDAFTERVVSVALVSP